MQHPSERFKSAIARNLAELQHAILNRDVMMALEAERATGHALFRISYLALYNDYMARTMKVFEESTRVASFWYLYKTDQGLADRFVRAEAIEIQTLRDISAKLKSVRDSTHFHIDANTVADTKRIWREAGIKGKELSNAFDNAWHLITHLQNHHHLPSVDLLPESIKSQLRKQIRRVTSPSAA
jgi:hypothetical protein